MEAEEFKERMVAYLKGELEGDSLQLFLEYLENNQEAADLARSYSGIWEDLDQMVVPEPRSEMDQRFYTHLYEQQKELDKHTQNGWRIHLKHLLGSIPKWAHALGILIVGIWIGISIPGRKELPERQITVSDETSEVREQLVFTLLKQPEATQRLQGVREVNKFSTVDDKVIRALLQTLNSDPNVNVRLAAITSLAEYADRPEVREGLIASIVLQESPVIQVTLADLMVQLQEKKSVRPIRELLEKPGTDTVVRKALEQSIRQIL